MKRILTSLLLLTLISCSEKSFKGFDKTYFIANGDKLYPSELSLASILETFGSNYEPIEVKSIQQLDANLNSIVQNVFTIEYNNQGIAFLIHSDKPILIENGKLKETNDGIEYSNIPIKEVRISNSKIRTNIGIQIGDSEGNVIEKFGSSEMPWQPLGYNSLGLSFDLDRQKIVNEISIYRPF